MTLSYLQLTLQGLTLQLPRTGWWRITLQIVTIHDSRKSSFKFSHYYTSSIWWSKYSWTSAIFLFVCRQYEQLQYDKRSGVASHKLSHSLYLRQIHTCHENLCDVHFVRCLLHKRSVQMALQEPKFVTEHNVRAYCICILILSRVLGLLNHKIVYSL